MALGNIQRALNSITTLIKILSMWNLVNAFLIKLPCLSHQRSSVWQHGGLLQAGHKPQAGFWFWAFKTTGGALDDHWARFREEQSQGLTHLQKHTLICKMNYTHLDTAHYRVHLTSLNCIYIAAELGQLSVRFYRSAYVWVHIVQVTNTHKPHTIHTHGNKFFLDVRNDQIRELGCPYGISVVLTYNCKLLFGIQSLRQIRLNEVLQDYSREAALIVVWVQWFFFSGAWGCYFPTR